MATAHARTLGEQQTIPISFCRGNSLRRFCLLPLLTVAASCVTEPLEPPPTLRVTTAALRDGVPNTPYSDTLKAIGGEGRYVWSVVSGSLPTNLWLNSGTGQLSGTPVGSASTFTVRVKSEDGQSDTKELTLAVNLVLTMTSSSVLNGRHMVPYADTLTAVGGIGGYVWSVSDGSLPTGLTIDSSTGSIAGTPTVVGAWNFMVQVASSDSQTDQQQLRITVNAILESVAAGGNHSCGVTTTGDPYCWGRNLENQLGDGGNPSVPVLFPVAVAGGLALNAVAGGVSHTCGVTTANVAYCWGQGADGQLGTGTSVDQPSPVAVSGGLLFQTVVAGWHHSCGLTPGGSAYCWGANGRGELGDGTNTNSNVPVLVSGGLVFQSITATTSLHTCGLTASGAAYCWGHGPYGQLGNSARADRNTPQLVVGGLTFASISAGHWLSCGVTTTGAAFCWGYGDSGQLGDGTNTNSNVPVAVQGGLTFRSVVAGHIHTCGVTPAGIGYCWGSNRYGQLGDSTNMSSNTPVPVSGGFVFRSLTAGFWHTCGTTTAGDAYCWGRNSDHQLANGSIRERNYPGLVSIP